MNTSSTQGVLARHAIDTALAALRANPDFWRLPLATTTGQLLHTAVSTGVADRAHLWQNDAGQWLLFSQDRSAAYATDATRAEPAPAYLARLALLKPFFTEAPASFDLRSLASPAFADAAADTASAAGAVLHLPVAVDGELWGVLILAHGHAHARAAPSTPAWPACDRYRAGAIADLVVQLLLAHRTLQAESRFQALAQNAPVGILQLDENMNVLYRNSYLLELTGRDERRMTEDVWSTFVASEDGHDIGLDVAKLNNTGSMQTSLRITRPDGSLRHVLWHVVTEPGTAARGRTGIALDITPLWKTQQELRELTVYQRAILDHAAHPIIVTDRNGQITLFNPAAERMLGYRADEVLGQSTRMFHTEADLAQLHRESQLQAEQQSYASMAGKVLRAGTLEREWTFVRQDGSQLPVRTATTLLHDEHGELLGLVGMAVDLSERNRLEAIEQREQSLIAHINRGTNTAIGEQFFEQLVAELRQATAAHYVNIFMRLPELAGLKGFMLNEPTSTAHSKGAVISFKDVPLESVIRDGESVHYLNAKTAYPDYAFIREIGLEELIAVPLRTSNGAVLGAMMIAHRGRLPEPVLTEHLLEIFAVRASSELERLQSERTLRQREAEQHWLYSASQAMHTQQDIAGVARAAVTSGARHTSQPRVTIMLSEGDSYRLLDYAGPPELAPLRSSYKRSEKIVGATTAAKNSTLLISDFLAASLDTDLHDEAIARDIRALIIISLFEDGRDIGALMLDYSDPTVLTQIDQDTLSTYGRSVALALGRALHRQALEHQAEHDALTGLYNRSVLHREFAQWHAGGGESTALLLLDLDRFKEVNDTFGHHVGDALLCKIGERLRTGLNYRKATLARLGGDEFAVLLGGLAIGETRARLLADNLLVALRRPFLIDGIQLEIGASIGVALYPQHGADSHALLRSADVAMYQAKQNGGGVTIYNPSFDFNTPERLRLITDFGNALRHRELALFYQPKVDIRSRQVVGFEALLRWQHPQLGLLAPDRFLPLVEMTDAIHALTATVLDIACAQLQAWSAAGEAWSVAVNLSARNLIDDRVVRNLQGLLQRYAIAPERLELEITETALIQDPLHALDILKQIAALGIALSIDDFGTGYSSLAYLRSMPISTLKIDRTFVRDLLTNPQDQLIARSIIQLAQSLDLKVIAEGVETSEVLAQLQAMGCDQAQGYYFSRPLPLAELDSWLAQWRAGTLRLGQPHPAPDLAAP